MLIQLLGDLGHQVDMQAEMRVWGLERVRWDPAKEEEGSQRVPVHVDLVKILSMFVGRILLTEARSPVCLGG